MLLNFDLKAKKNSGVSNYFDKHTFSQLKVQSTYYDVYHCTKSIVTILDAIFREEINL